MDISGASAIVTGGASGLGEATARLLAERGAKVVVMDLDRQQERGDALAKEIGGLFAPADVTDAEQVQAAVAAAGEMGPLRALVNCCGRRLGAAAPSARTASSPPRTTWRSSSEVIDINLVGTFDCIRIAASAMSSQRAD
jgi:NAD(P)-dependent dehydrogenase (short-subunit alcohol dehydrogenase family)